MMASVVCEYILVVLTVRVEELVWFIEKLCTALMPLMVVTSMPLELSEVEVKDGLIAGSKGVLLMEHRGEL